MIKNILWDFDGVIAESVNVKTEAFRDLYIEYGDDIAKKVVDHHMAHGGVSRYEKFKIYHRDFLGEEINGEQVEELATKFSELVKEKVVAAPYIDGVKEYLENYSTDLTFYVISGTPHDEMKEIVERRGLAKYFKSVMGSPKTKTEWINFLVESDGLSIEESVFIGDATTDYKAALNTNMKFVLREVDYNLEFFEDYKGPRVSNFVEFQNIIGSL